MISHVDAGRHFTRDELNDRKLESNEARADSYVSSSEART